MYGRMGAAAKTSKGYLQRHHEKGRRNAGLSYFCPQRESHRSLWAAISSFVPRLKTLRSFSVVVIGLTHRQLVSIGTIVALQPSIKLSISKRRYFSFDMRTLLNGFNRFLCLDDFLLFGCLLGAFLAAGRLAQWVADERAEDGQQKPANRH